MAAKTLYFMLIVVLIVCLIQSAVAAPQVVVSAPQEAVPAVVAPQVVVNAEPTPIRETPPGILESFRDLMGSIFTKFATVL